jgi:hypothetical protein
VFDLPIRLERLLVLGVLLYRRIRFGYCFRRIPLTQGRCAIVDPADYYRQVRHKWHTAKGTRTVYAVRQICLGKGKTKAVHMHREIIDAPAGMYVDHINQNGLDNRRANLRLATRFQNARNRPKTNRATSSKYKGVTYRPKQDKWTATIFANGRSVHLGHFKTEIEAARAYDNAAREHYGRFAALNFAQHAPPGRARGQKQRR